MKKTLLVYLVISGFAGATLRAEMPPPDMVKFTGLSPEQAAKEMSLPPGFKATLFAGEPDVMQPIAFAIDDRGRLWVAEAYTYPNRIGTAPKDTRPADSDHSKPTPEQLKDIFGGKDRIIVFEDPDGDGKFNRRTIFLEGLNLVSGIELGFGGVWIGAAPYLMFVPVQDGDEPKPAGPPQIVLDGWAYQDTHETLNTFTWGPDGWLYGCHGVFTHSNVGRPGAPDSERTRLNAGVWRYHPTKKVFELFAEGTSNPWGIDFDEHGQCFIEACVIPHLFHMIQGGHYQRQAGSHFNPYVYDDIKTIADHVHYAGDKGPHAGNARSAAVGGGHAHAGLMIYQGDNWPEKYRGQIYIGNIHGACINMDTPVRQGSGFVGKHNPNFINFNDKWSQVINFQSGPDGAVYFIDWYDKNECHSGDPNVHDRSNGRIFKVSYGETKFQKVDLQQKSTPDLFESLMSQNAWHSRHAQRILQERGSRNEITVNDRTLLREFVSPSPRAVAGRNTLQTANTNADGKLHLVWAMHVTHELHEQDALLLLRHGVGAPVRLWENGRDVTGPVRGAIEYVRAWLIQLTCEDRKISSEMLKEFAGLAREDKSPIVRLYLASAMQRLPVEDRWEVVEALSQHAEDANDHNLPLTVWYAAEPLPTKDIDRALKLAQNAKLPNILNFMVRRTAALNTPEAFAAITETLQRSGDDPHRLDILNGLTAALKGQRSAPIPKGWEEIEKNLGASSNAEIRARVQSLSLTFGSATALTALRATLADDAADLSARETALASLLGVKDSALPPLLQKLLTNPKLQGQALRGLAAFGDSRTPAAILSVYKSLGGAEKRDALNTLAARPQYAMALLTAVGEKQIPASELTADLVNQLRNLKNADLDALLAEVWGTARELTADKQAEIEKYRNIYRAGGSQPGDAMRGRLLFAKVCQQCHTLFGTGGRVGPELTGSNRKDLDYLLQNIVDPNAVIPNDYRGWIVETKDDRTITGVMKEQNERTVTVATQTETLTIPRNEIQTLQEGQLSMMPEGLLTQLSEQDVRDLLFYLRQPGQVPLIATADNLALFFNGKDLSCWDGDTSLWQVENGEIVGKTTTGLKHNEFLKSQFVLEDFRLVCKVKLTPNSANSGIQFRSEPHGEYEMKGCQADIGAGWWGKLYEENGRALISKKSGEAFVKTNDWNTYEIVAVGGKIRTAINGQLCVDLEDPQVARRGITGLQVHAGGPTEVRFKDFQLELNPKFELVTAQR